jgi:hypothetical protein
MLLIAMLLALPLLGCAGDDAGTGNNTGGTTGDVEGTGGDTDNGTGTTP